MKRIKTFESYIDSAQSEGLYDKMSSLLSDARELYFEVTGEDASFNNPEDAIRSLSEFNNMEDVNILLSDIKALQNEIDELESESYYNEFEYDEE